MRNSNYIITVVISVMMASCGSRLQQEEKDIDTGFSKEFLQNIETVAVTEQNIERQLKLTGKVEYDPDRIVHYIPLVSGVVESTHFSLGDKVSKGQTMVVIRSVELSAMYAEKQSLEAEIKILNRNLESTHSMYKDNLSSQKELMEAQERLKQAEADLEKVKSNLSLYGLPGTDGTFMIKSPMNGFVIDRNIAPGTQVNTDGDPLFTVADISKVWITANVYAGNLAFIKQGIPVDIRTSAYPDEIFHGKIDVIPQVFDSEEHVVKASIVMSNTDLKLKPEMAVDLTLKDDCDLKTACLPSKALIFDENRYFVVRQEDENFAVVEVKLYMQTNETSYIESGISPNDKVVIKDQLLMFNRLKK